MPHGAGPDTDTPVEALIRHNITVHRSKQVRFLHGLMLVLMVGFGAVFVVLGAMFVAQDWLLGGLMFILVGVFLMLYGPYARKTIAADTARKTAALEWQLDQAKAQRMRDGRDY